MQHHFEHFGDVPYIIFNWCGMRTKDAYSFGHPGMSYVGLDYALMLNPSQKLDTCMLPVFQFQTSLGTSILLV